MLGLREKMGKPRPMRRTSMSRCTRFLRGIFARGEDRRLTRRSRFFVFPLTTAKARKPLYASNFVADYLRPAAKKIGVHIGDGQRFGPHNLRHSLSNWPVNKAEVEPKTVQGILRHSKIQTMLDLYT
jgi:integrase